MKQWKFALHGAIQSCEMRAKNFYACVFYNRIYIRMCTKYSHLFTRNDPLGQMIRSFQRSGNFLIILHSNWARVCSNYDYKFVFSFCPFLWFKNNDHGKKLRHLSISFEKCSHHWSRYFVVSFSSHFRFIDIKLMLCVAQRSPHSHKYKNANRHEHFLFNFITNLMAH